MCLTTVLVACVFLTLLAGLAYEARRAGFKLHTCKGEYFCEKCGRGTWYRV